MGIFDKLTGSKETRPETVAETPPCPHGALVPRWDNAADMGHKDRVSGFKCEACDQTFTPEEAAAMQGSVAEKLATPVKDVA